MVVAVVRYWMLWVTIGPRACARAGCAAGPARWKKHGPVSSARQVAEFSRMSCSQIVAGISAEDGRKLEVVTNGILLGFKNV